MVFVDFYYSEKNRFHALAALRQVYPRYSLKRRVAYLANAINVLTLRRAPNKMSLVGSLLEEIPAISTDGAMALLTHKVSQNGRVYAFEFNSTKLMSVTKIALTGVARSGVVREHAVLRKLERAGLPFLVPHVSYFRDVGDACILCTSAIGQEYRIHDKKDGLPNYVFDAMASLRPKDAPLAQACKCFHWFTSSLNRVTNPIIREIAQQISPDAQFLVCSAHSDLGSENVFSLEGDGCAKPKFAVIDWEFFTDTAPALTDRVGFWLGQHHRNFKRDVGSWDEKTSATRFLGAFKDAPGGVEAATLALLGLLHIGNDLAERLCGALK